MKVSRHWLQNFFDTPLPSAKDIDTALTFHAFEIEEREDDLIDVNVLPNRAGDSLCHRGIAKEISAILDVPFSSDPLRQPIPTYEKSSALSVTIENPLECLRYMGAIVRGVKVGPSPAWLKEALESVGQRSINNVVDATNYVMLNIGQPLHAFDADKLVKKDDAYHIQVRLARDGEEITTLSGEKYTLSKQILLITDSVADVPIGIAGIKGGAVAQVDEATTTLIVEAANFDGPTIRRSAQKLNLITDASLRFQNKPSPELVAYGMRDVLELIIKIADGTVEAVTDEYPARPSARVAPVSVTLPHICDVLGTTLSLDVVSDIFRRLDLSAKIDGDTFTITPPFERVDIIIPEDLIEEVGRIAGYDTIPDKKLPKMTPLSGSEEYNGIERIKDFLVEQGFTELYTRSFAKKGDIALANPLDKTKPMLRTSLVQNMALAMTQAKQYSPRVLGPNDAVKLFEIGTVFTKDDEHMTLALSEEVPELNKLLQYKDTPPTKEGIIEYALSSSMLIALGTNYTPKHYAIVGAYKPFSIYPFVLRDIAVWTPERTASTAVKEIINTHSGELLVRIDQFDSFTKDARTSFAFRLVFESQERTLTDELVNTHMKKITDVLNENSGYEVR